MSMSGGFESRSSAEATGRVWSSCTVGPPTAVSGAGSSTRCRTSSRWWRGMRPGRASHRTHRRRSASPIGPTALELYRRHPAIPKTLILTSAYAGWAGSLSAAVVDERRELYLRNAELPPGEWAPAVIQTLLTERASGGMVDELMSIFSEFHPVGMKAGVRAFAEADVRDVLPHIDVPALLLYGDKDVRAPRPVWEALHSAIPGSKLVVLPDVGHLINIEAADRFNTEVRVFLRALPA